MRPRLLHDDQGVSPVIGTILVLAISVAGIAGVLYWGLPAVTEMKASVEQQTITNSYLELENDIKELSRADVGKTAILWRYSQADGAFSLQPSTERWVLEMDSKSTLSPPVTYNFSQFGLNQTGNKFFLVNHGPAISANVIASSMDASAVIPLNVKLLPAGSTWSTPCSPTLPNETAGWAWAAGAVQGFCVYNSTWGPINMGSPLLQLQVWNWNSNAALREVAGYFWSTDSGRMQWLLSSALSSRAVYLGNGATMSGTNGNIVVQGDPTITAPQCQGGQERFFERLVSLNGSASLGGAGSSDVLLSLYGSPQLANQLPATDAKLWTSGTLGGVWTSYFNSHSYNFDAVAETPALTSSVGYYSAPQWLEYTPRHDARCTSLTMIVQQDVIQAGVGSS
ncbi:MAG: hypothetical protein ACYDDF_01940 [Thermoplasmatota archaeon]